VKTRTAALLGIDRRNLTYFLHKHGIQTPSLPSTAVHRIDGR
jgi:hypothetical protein